MSIHTRLLISSYSSFSSSSGISKLLSFKIRFILSIFKSLGTCFLSHFSNLASFFVLVLVFQEISRQFGIFEDGFRHKSYCIDRYKSVDNSFEPFQVLQSLSVLTFQHCCHHEINQQVSIVIITIFSKALYVLDIYEAVSLKVFICTENWSWPHRPFQFYALIKTFFILK